MHLELKTGRVVDPSEMSLEYAYREPTGLVFVVRMDRYWIYRDELPAHTAVALLQASSPVPMVAVRFTPAEALAPDQTQCLLDCEAAMIMFNWTEHQFCVCVCFNCEGGGEECNEGC